MSDELKPCPFCGITPKLEYNSIVKFWYRGECTPYCEGHAALTWASREFVMRNWNERPVEDALRAENAALMAQWEAVPWEALRSICEEAFDATDAVCEVDDWLDANAPKQEPHP